MRVISDVLARARTTWLLLVVLDLAAVVAVGLLVVPPLPPGSLALASAAVLLVCQAGGLHRQRLVLSVLDDVAPLALAAVGAGLVLLAVRTDRGSESLSCTAVFAVSTFAAALALRTLVYAAVHVLRSSGSLSRPTLIVGAGSTGRRIAETLLTRRELGLRPLGIIDGGRSADLRGLPLPLLGQVEDLEEVIDDLGIRDIVFAFPGRPDAETVDAVRGCLQRGHQVYVVPRFFEVVGADLGQQTEWVRDIAIMRLTRRRGRGAGPTRVLDAAVAAGALVVLAPLLLLIAIAVRIETRASVLVQRPVPSHDGRATTMLQFRTLRPAEFGPDTTSWSLDHDRRTGPVGRLLRRTALEELPQLIDVLRGQRRLLGGRSAVAPTGGTALDPQRAPTGEEGWAWLTPEPLPDSHHHDVVPDVSTGPGQTPDQRRAETSRR